ncbi:MAG: GTP-binding protein [Clostridia bacterium]|nr:GTP-binding protein [Clostridia bacterium]
MTKIDIISGFLGAGKTTLIKKLIKEAYAGEKLVLIENEFGEIGIDGGFLQDAGINITEMNSGCICCSLVGDFGKALAKVLDEYHPDRILIEPSGVGKLSDVIRAVQGIENPEAKLNSFTAVCDAGKCKMYIKNFGEFYNDQVENASAIIMSHTGGMSEDKIAKAFELLREKNANAVIVTTPWDELDGKQLLEAIEGNDTLKCELEELLKSHNHHHHHDDEECECGHHHHHHDDEESECGHHHHHHDDEECECGHHHHHHDDEECECGHHHHHHDDEECECGHHHHHADEVFTSCGFETTKKFTESAIAGALKALENEAEYGMVLRAKGIVMAEDGGWIHFDYVPGEPDVRRGSSAITGRLCVIGAKIDEDKLKSLFGV